MQFAFYYLTVYIIFVSIINITHTSIQSFGKMQMNFGVAVQRPESTTFSHLLGQSDSCLAAHGDHSSHCLVQGRLLGAFLQASVVVFLLVVATLFDGRHYFAVLFWVFRCQFSQLVVVMLHDRRLHCHCTGHGAFFTQQGAACWSSTIYKILLFNIATLFSLPAPSTKPAMFQKGMSAVGRTRYFTINSSKIFLCSFSCSHMCWIRAADLVCPTRFNVNIILRVTRAI
jgi:hypothetical protein